MVCCLWLLSVLMCWQLITGKSLRLGIPGNHNLFSRIFSSQKTLDGFVEAAQSSYGCIMVNRRVCVSTECW